jgi:cytochrome oxidase assembly protein ShyY1
VIVLSVLFVFLGRWQYHRHLARTAKNDLITGNNSSSPVPLDQVLPGVQGSPGSRVPYQAQWRPVSMRGHYLPASTVLIRNRPYSTGANDSQNGYEVVVPFTLDSDPVVVLVNRGWIPAGSSASQPKTVPAPPAGTVQVVARLRPSEPASTRQAPPGQALRINAGQLAAQLRLPAPLDRRVLDGFAVLASETPRPPGATPSELEPPDPGLGINLAYAVQWVLFAGAAYVLLGVAAVKEIRRRAAGGMIGRA